MPRRRRRFTSRRSAPQRRPKADWVYRGADYIPGDPADNDWLEENPDLASYGHSVQGVTAGLNGAAAWILYDSMNRRAQLLNTFSTAGGWDTVALLPRAARAEGRNPLILATEGQLLIRPSTWALGSLMAFGLRIGIFEQDPSDGLLLLDAEYHMRNAFAGSTGHSQAATWANDRMWVWERRYYVTFDSTRPAALNLDIRWRGRRTLKPHQCFAIYCEADSASVNLTVQRWMRTLVVDEG